MNVSAGLITPNYNDKVLYRMKVEMLNDNLRMKKVAAKKGRKVTAVMFDERKDVTKEKGNIDPLKKENCTVINFPGKRKRNDVNQNKIMINKVKVSEDHLDDELLKEPLEFSENVRKAVKKAVEPTDELLGKRDGSLNGQGEDQEEYIGCCQPELGTGKGLAVEVPSQKILSRFRGPVMCTN